MRLGKKVYSHQPPSTSGQSGQLTVLIIGLTLVGLLVISAVVAVSSVYIEQKRLLSAADSCAQVGAEGFNFASTSQAPRLSLKSELVRVRVSKFARDSEYVERFDQFEVTNAAVTDDNSSATVTLSAVAHPPILSLIVPGGIRIEATSTSRPRSYQ